MITPAAPIAHDESIEGGWLYERLTNQVGETRHGPSNTTWVYAYRGVWRDRHAIVFRPGPWLLPSLNNRTEGIPIHDDLVDQAMHFGRTPAYCWAIVEAPLGVRLRALVLELARRGTRLSDATVLALVARTREAFAAGRTGDTFITWDGSLWLAPTFPRSWKSETRSLMGTETYDALTLDCGYAMRQVLAGVLPRPIWSHAAEQVRAEHRLEVQIDELQRHLAIPGDVAPELAAIVHDEWWPRPSTSGEPFFQRCAAVGGASDTERATLGALARELFPEVYARQLGS